MVDPDLLQNIDKPLPEELENLGKPLWTLQELIN